MALNPTTLRNLIKANVEAVTGNDMPDVALDVWEAVAQAIVTHITTSGTLAVVTTCGAGAGTGTGTIV